MHLGMSVATSMAFMSTCKPGLSSSLLSLWLSLDSQSVMHRSGPSFYMMFISYWLNFRKMDCFLNMVTGGFWSAMVCTSLLKQ